MNQNKAGEIVQLKSGGPKMTTSAFSGDRTGGVVCHWFVGDELKRGEFSKEELEVVKLGKPASEL